MCDLDNKRVQILDKNGKFIRQFGRPGTHGGAMHVSYHLSKQSYLFVKIYKNRILKNLLRILSGLQKYSL